MGSQLNRIGLLWILLGSSCQKQHITKKRGFNIDVICPGNKTSKAFARLEEARRVKTSS